MLKTAVTVPDRGTEAYNLGNLVVTIEAIGGDPVVVHGREGLDIIRVIQKHGGIENHEVTFSTDAWDIFQRGIVEGVSLIKSHLKKGLEGCDF